MSAEKFSSKIEIVGKRNILQAYYDALVPEAKEKGRASYSLKLGKEKLIIKIAAKDATAFRAIITSLAGFIAIVNKSIGEKNGK